MKKSICFGNRSCNYQHLRLRTLTITLTTQLSLFLDEATPGFIQKELATAITRLQSNGLLKLRLPQRKGLLWEKRKVFRKRIKTKNHRGMGKHYIRDNKEMHFVYKKRLRAVLSRKRRPH